MITGVAAGMRYPPMYLSFAVISGRENPIAKISLISWHTVSEVQTSRRVVAKKFQVDVMKLCIFIFQIAIQRIDVFFL
jgi:hypothetical protein